jgi:hypothetical protein
VGKPVDNAASESGGPRLTLGARNKAALSGRIAQSFQTKPLKIFKNRKIRKKYVSCEKSLAGIGW